MGKRKRLEGFERLTPTEAKEVLGYERPVPYKSREDGDWRGKLTDPRFVSKKPKPWSVRNKLKKLIDEKY